MSDEEGALFKHFIFAARAPIGRKSSSHRHVLDALNQSGSVPDATQLVRQH